MSSLATQITRTEPTVKAYQSPRVVSVWPGRGRYRKVGLKGFITDRPIPQLVLVVTGRWHPGTIARAAAVVVPEIPPGAHAILGEIGVAEVAVEQMEQGPQPLDAERGVAGCRRAEVVVHERQARQGDAGGRRAALAQARRSL